MKDQGLLIKRTIFHPVFILLILVVYPLLLYSSTGDCRPGRTSMQRLYINTANQSIPSIPPTPALQDNTRFDNCISASRVIGVLSGSAMGMFAVYVRASGISGVSGPFWKSLLIGSTSMVIGGYVGSRSTEWATRRIMYGEPKPGMAFVKGVGYGAIDGAIIGVASLVPLLTLGHFTGSITFNPDSERVLLHILGSAILGGATFGGMIGAGVGAVYGPAISLYMQF